MSTWDPGTGGDDAAGSSRAMLIVVSGLPGSGKSTLATRLAAALRASLYSVDQIEATLWRSGIGPEQRSGYAAYDLLAVLSQQALRQGRSVLVDAVSAYEEIRDMWRVAAEETASELHVIHCVCSDRSLHRLRLEGRTRDLPGFAEPSWPDVLEVAHRFEPWRDAHLRVDTTRPLHHIVEEAERYVRSGHASGGTEVLDPAAPGDGVTRR